jgi:hypothetical protein
MFSADFNREGYSDNYIESRKQIDKLCDHIVLGAISVERAREEFLKIEIEFDRENPEIKDLFRMVYRSRLTRLAHQFPPEKI